MRTFAVVCCVYLSLSLAARGAVIHVDRDAISGANDGSSWADAFTDLQDALAAAASGDEIWVAEGVYKPTDTADRTVSFQLVEGCALYGGFAGTESAREERDWTAHETILSGDLNGDDDPGYPLDYRLVYNEDNSYCVVRGASDARIDGCAVCGGGQSFRDRAGGGMANRSVSNVAVENCAFRGNYAQDGGGMFNLGSTVVVVNTVFAGNAALSGGAIQNKGSSPVVKNCTFVQNSGHGCAGLKFEGDCTATVDSCTFLLNRAGYCGGAIDTWKTTCSPTITNCTFVANCGGRYGGALRIDGARPSVANCTFLGNKAESGGAVNARNDATPEFANCVFSGNKASSACDVFHLEDTASPTVAYSCVEGGYHGEGNVDADPLLVAPGSWDDNNTPEDDTDDFWIDGDYHLQPGSPCIDSADGDAAPGLDIEGNPRHDDPGMPNVGTGAVTYADMGAYEFQGTTGTVTGTVMLQNGADGSLVTITAGGRTASTAAVSGGLEYEITGVLLVTAKVAVSTTQSGYEAIGSPAPITWAGTEGTAADVTIRAVRIAGLAVGEGCLPGQPSPAPLLLLALACALVRRRRSLTPAGVDRGRHEAVRSHASAARGTRQ